MKLNLQKAIANLESVLKEPKTDVVRDSSIKRFEICFDLAWKSIKQYAQKQGLECYSPRECIKTAFQLKLVEHTEKWLEMLDDRNMLVHMYDEQTAEKVYEKLKDYEALLRGLSERLSSLNEEN